MSSKLEPAIRSLVTGERIPCFDRCQLTWTWMFDIKDMRCKTRLHDLVLDGASVMVAMLCDVVVVGRTHPRSMPVAAMLMRKELHGFLFLYMRAILFL